MQVRIPIVRLSLYQYVYACEPDFNEYRNPYPKGSRDYQFLDALYSLSKDIAVWTAESGIELQLYVHDSDRNSGYGKVDIIINEEDVGWYAFLINHKVATSVRSSAAGYCFSEWTTYEITQVPYEHDKEFNTADQS